MKAVMRKMLPHPRLLPLLLLAWPLACQAAASAWSPSLPLATGGAQTQVPEPVQAWPLELAQGSIRELNEALQGQRKPAKPSPPPAPPLSPELELALEQAAGACRKAYVNAYESRLATKRQTIETAKLKIPKLQVCIGQSRQMVTQGRQTRRELDPPLANNRAEQQRLQAEIKALTQQAEHAEDKPVLRGKSWDEAQKKLEVLQAQLAGKKTAQAELERKARLMDGFVQDQLVKESHCDADLKMLRERISAAEKAMAKDGNVPRLFEIHKQKRFVEILRLQQNRDLHALKRCADQGYLELDDLMKNLFP